MGKVRFKQQLDQKFQLRQVSLQIIYNDDNILIKSENATRPLLSELKNELVYDGYAESGEVEEGCIHLYEADVWPCNDSLKETLLAKLDSMNYEVTFRP